jgi:hypothetical protein
MDHESYSWILDNGLYENKKHLYKLDIDAMEYYYERVGRKIGFTEEEWELSMDYTWRFNEPFNLNINETTDGAFFSIENIKRSIETGNQKFTGFEADFRELIKLIENTDRKH